MSSNETGKRNELKAPDAIRSFTLGGNACLTLTNTKRNTHVTMRLKRGKVKSDDQHPPIFVRILTGSDNERWGDYSFVGTIFDWDKKNDRAQKPKFVWSRKKSKLDAEDRRVRAVSWLIDFINGDVDGSDKLPSNVEIWHEGRCCYCYKVLTQTESIRLGYGPECAKQRGLPYGKRTKPAKGKAETKTPPTPEPEGKEVTWIDVRCNHCGAEVNRRCKSPRGEIKKPHDRRVSWARRKERERLSEIRIAKRKADVAKFGECEQRHCTSPCISKKDKWCRHHENEVKEKLKREEELKRQGKCTKCEYHPAEKKGGICKNCRERAEAEAKRKKEREEAAERQRKEREERDRLEREKREARLKAEARKAEYEKQCEDGKSPLIDRVCELTTQGWSSDAAMKQAQHELEGFTIWLPEMGLPQAAIEDQEGNTYELADVDEDDLEDAELLTNGKN